ncbi:bifunctional homocysteine S-methyltransferase/methylenetetrahydrofolate reductase [Jeotgalibacillus proteolyticus]|uniref:Bifunctional homocysteine S-methyltransferase/methylenetetrahydrofolate reductase n=1 Tax=Jeotgalibacillus proteolyticus TaxID=2082395 RepID=A0A2S5G7E1_9BACL|nr:bifunctional homocysteine S-methyltransferase/methylenetetrahydrofolate reductase [Jeotgalibacillus proteolyticus]PPA68907.1 bifunctional homocysteine S-methyltransferase/methylenetetrahydrofolate reductase [Jeotgalibacillus proteolyticus]
MNLREELRDRILIADGAMGTLLYSYGTDQCFEELNVSQAEHIQKIHSAYIEAGANVIQTNTYGGNYLKLERYGLQDHVKEINSAAVRNAKLAADAADKGTHILGTIGGIRSIRPQSIELEEIKRTFREQLYCLLLEGVDGLLLETYYDLEELSTVVDIARQATDLPIIAQVSLQEIGVLQDGTPVANALKQLEELGADGVGINCRQGPFHMLRSLESVPLPKHAFLSSYPNASLPSYAEGSLQYNNNAEYFGECARSFQAQGVRLLGGCCGTTPDHIRAFSEALEGAAPITEKKVETPEPKIEVKSKSLDLPEPLSSIVSRRPSVIVELDPPKKLNTDAFMKGAKVLTEAGADAITLADNSLASPRVSNESLGHLIKQESGARPLVHITCRDRNLIGLQSHLMGLHTLGLHDLLAVTGDPTKVGDFPGATSVYDVSSFELIEMISQLNNGVSMSGKDLGEKTSFSIGAAFNPHVRSVERAVLRMEKKIAAGADYFMSQPVFSQEKLLEVYEHTKHIEKPLYIGLMPLTGSRNAEFLHHEVPGIKLSDEVRERMAKVSDDKEKSAKEGIAITKSLIDAALEMFNGIYLITPFMRYEVTAELTRYANEQAAKRAGGITNVSNIIQ